uniref:RNA-binding protein 12-like n=1 Tax=Gouania willdenowi TaxID=441366 RepID=A0A8C5ECK2_GOUWI
MSKILRLEGLGSNASAEDIRTFFDYLHIPEGGVYIVGGSLQEAFIAFKTERQGQLAMLHSGNLLKGFPVTLHSSSMDELELKLESVTAFILKMLTALKSLQSPDQIQEIDSVKTNGDSIVADKVESHGQNVNKEAGYVRLFGLPPTTTKEDICQFFHGLTVEEVIVNAKLEHKHACLVKFASTEDASDALRFNKETFGTAWVEVLPKSVKHDDKRPLARLSKRSLKQSSHIIMVSNLPKTITKTDLKELFRCPNIPHKDDNDVTREKKTKKNVYIAVITNSD